MGLCYFAVFPVGLGLKSEAAQKPHEFELGNQDSPGGLWGFVGRFCLNHVQPMGLRFFCCRPCEFWFEMDGSQLETQMKTWSLKSMPGNSNWGLEPQLEAWLLRLKPGPLS